MAGNTFGKNFTVTTAGESHGPGYLAIVDGCPAGLALTEENIQVELDKRKPGQSRYTTQRREADQVTIYSGVFEGKTTGAPIGLLINNTDQRSRDYGAIKDIFRPGHADYTYYHKYGIRDYRGGGRASARETMMRVAAGAIAQKYLHDTYGVKITSYLAQLGEIIIPCTDLAVIEQNAFFAPDLASVPKLEQAITRFRAAGDSIGARVNTIVQQVPIGLGEPVFDRLDADIAKAMMSINAVKGVEIGAGFASITQTGSAHRDELSPEGFLSNHAGGILGGISSGQDITASIAFKPTSSITKPGQTVDVNTQATEVITKGRHDPCVGIRGVPIATAMMALVLMDHVLLLRR